MIHTVKWNIIQSNISNDIVLRIDGLKILICFQLLFIRKCMNWTQTSVIVFRGSNLFSVFLFDFARLFTGNAHFIDTIRKILSTFFLVLLFTISTIILLPSIKMNEESIANEKKEMKEWTMKIKQFSKKREKKSYVCVFFSQLAFLLSGFSIIADYCECCVLTAENGKRKRER